MAAMASQPKIATVTPWVSKIAGLRASAKPSPAPEWAMPRASSALTVSRTPSAPESRMWLLASETKSMPAFFTPSRSLGSPEKTVPRRWKRHLSSTGLSRLASARSAEVRSARTAPASPVRFVTGGFWLDCEQPAPRRPLAPRPGPRPRRAPFPRGGDLDVEGRGDRLPVPGGHDHHVVRVVRVLERRRKGGGGDGRRRGPEADDRHPGGPLGRRGRGGGGAPRG